MNIIKSTEYEYYERQLAKATRDYPASDFDCIRIKVITDQGESNWLSLNELSCTALISWMIEQLGPVASQVINHAARLKQ